MREALLSLHAYRQNDAQAKSICDLDNCPIHQLLLQSDDLTLFDTTFELALETLAKIGAYVEPDGSFTRGGRENGVAWSVGGMLYDEGSRLAYVDFAGKAPSPIWQEMFDAIQPTSKVDPTHTPVVYLKAEGVFADIDEFLAWLDRVQSTNHD